MNIPIVSLDAGKTRSCAGWLALNLVVLAVLYGHIVLPEREAKRAMEIQMTRYAATVIKLSDENQHLKRRMHDTSCFYAMN